jgi:hypothetical protein
MPEAQTIAESLCAFMKTLCPILTIFCDGGILDFVCVALKIIFQPPLISRVQLVGSSILIHELQVA